MNQIINRSWIIVDDVRFAVDCIVAFEAGELAGNTATVVYLTGGHTVRVGLSVQEFQATIERAV